MTRVSASPDFLSAQVSMLADASDHPSQELSVLLYLPCTPALMDVNLFLMLSQY